MISEIEMAKNPPEIRKTICKECGSEIDEMGCVYTCKYDTVNFAERDPKTLEVHVYVLTRTEPYDAKLEVHVYVLTRTEPYGAKKE